MGSIPWSPLARGALTRLPSTAGIAENKTFRQGTDELPPDTYFQMGAGSKDIVNRCVLCTPRFTA